MTDGLITSKDICKKCGVIFPRTAKFCYWATDKPPFPEKTWPRNCGMLKELKNLRCEK